MKPRLTKEEVYNIVLDYVKKYDLGELKSYTDTIIEFYHNNDDSCWSATNYLTDSSWDGDVWSVSFQISDKTGEMIRIEGSQGSIDLPHLKIPREIEDEWDLYDENLDIIIKDWKHGIPKFPKLEKVVPLPFHEKTNQFIIDYKELSETQFFEKYYKLQNIWHNADEYIVASKQYGNLGKVFTYVLVHYGFIAETDYDEEITSDHLENFWGDVPVKLVKFDLQDGLCYYAYIPQSTDLKSILDVKIEDIHMGLLEQGGLDMGGLK